MKKILIDYIYLALGLFISVVIISAYNGFKKDLKKSNCYKMPTKCDCRVMDNYIQYKDTLSGIYAREYF